MTWKVFLEKKEYSGEENLRIARFFPDRIEVVQPLQFMSYDRHAATVPETQVALAGNFYRGEGDIAAFLQAIVDCAWKAGIRPSGLEDHTNELKAVRDHLADMRALALSDGPLVMSGTPKIEVKGLS